MKQIILAMIKSYIIKSLTSFKFILGMIIPLILLILAFRMWGWFGLIGLFIGLTLFSLVKIYQNRRLILDGFNFAAIALKAGKFNPLIVDNDEDIKLKNVFGLEDKNERIK